MEFQYLNKNVNVFNILRSDKVSFC